MSTRNYWAEGKVRPRSGVFADREKYDLGHNELLESIKLESSLKTHSCVGEVGREEGGREVN